MAIGPRGETFLDYAIFDARRAGFEKVILVIRQDQEPAFRYHLTRIWRDRPLVIFAHQDAFPPMRETPWGTGHAVLLAGHHVREPFCTINADDWYGPSAFRLLADHFGEFAGSDPPNHAMIGYRLADTPSSTEGGVSRGVVGTDDEGMAVAVVEVRNIEPSGSRFMGTTPTGERVTLTGDEMVSMGCWGFFPEFLAELAGHFASFCKRIDPSDTNEFLTGDSLNRQISSRHARLRVIPASEPAVGITYQDDVGDATAFIRERVGADQYPEDLAAGL